MKINIKEKEVTIADDTGGILIMTLDQLLELVNTINAATNQDGGLIFSLIEFTV